MCKNDQTLLGLEIHVRKLMSESALRYLRTFVCEGGAIGRCFFMIYLFGKDPAISSEKKQAFLDIFNEKICLEELF